MVDSKAFISKRLKFLVDKRAENALHAYLKSGDYKNDSSLREIIPELNKTLVVKLSEFDPTPEGKYVQWLLREYAKGRFTLQSNKDEIRSLIENFEQFKTIMTRNDIYKHSMKSLTKSLKFLDSMPKHQRMSKKEFNKWFKEYLRSSGQVSVFYDNLETRSKIIRLNDYQAAKFYSMGTRWCISGRGYFEHYKEQGDLYCIFYRKQKYLMHFYLDRDVDVPAWSFEIASADDNYQDPVYISSLGIQKHDLEFGAMVSEIMIWVALSNGIKLHSHSHNLLFPELHGQPIISLSRYLTMPTHRMRNLSSSIVSLKGYSRHWAEQFSNCIVVPSLKLTPPSDEVLMVAEQNDGIGILDFYDLNFETLKNWGIQLNYEQF